MTLDWTKWESKFEGQKVKTTRNENVKLVFRAYLHEKWFDLRQTTPEMILSPLYIYTFLQQKHIIFATFVCMSDYLSFCLLRIGTP